MFRSIISFNVSYCWLNFFFYSILPGSGNVGMLLRLLPFSFDVVVVVIVWTSIPGSIISSFIFSNARMKRKKNFQFMLKCKTWRNLKVRYKNKSTINILFYLFKHCGSCQILIVRHLLIQIIKVFVQKVELFAFCDKFVANARMRSSFRKVSLISIPGA